jgi:hypothetical protein
MSDDSLPPLTPEQIKELRLQPHEVEKFEQDLGGGFDWFLSNWVDGELPNVRLRELDIHSTMANLRLNELADSGIVPIFTGMYIGFYLIVGDEEWNFTL